MSARATSANRPKAGPASEGAGQPASPSAPRGRLGVVSARLAHLGGRNWLGAAIAAALVLGLLGFVIGLNVGRPSWPADGSAEVGFARDMSTHHAQAVEMGMIAFQKASREHVRSIGYDIVLAQQGQIGTMQGWLDTWGAPTNTSDRPMAWVPGGEAMLDGNRMPGMATREEIGQLMEATGEQVDILFLQYMIRHHLGGLHMVDAVIADDTLPEVRELAETMKANQGAEVIVMQNLLRDLGASPLPN